MANKYSLYPTQIDTSVLPLTTDLKTLVVAEVVNRLRDSVLSIQRTLGLNPQSTFASVADRLTAGGGGGGGTGFISILKENVPIQTQANSLNFSGDVVVTTGAAHQATVTIGGNTKLKQEEILVANNQTSIGLSAQPLQSNSVMVFVNGLKQSYSLDYTVVGDKINYISPIPLKNTDEVEAWYLINSATIGGSNGTIITQQGGIEIDPTTQTVNFLGNVSVDQISSGVVNVTVADQAISESKVRVYRSSSQVAPTAGVPATVVWDSESAILSRAVADRTGGNTQLNSLHNGTYHIHGQLSISPSTTAVSSLTIEILKNASVIHSFTDAGVAWDVGVTRTFNFALDAELLSVDAISVRWTHQASIATTTQLVGGDSLTWFGIEKYNSLSFGPSVADSIPYTVTSVKTSAYKTDVGELVRCDPTGGTFVINLPSAIGNLGKNLIVKNISNSTNQIKIQAFGSETIDGLNIQSIVTALLSLTLVSDNNNWVLV